MDETWSFELKCPIKCGKREYFHFYVKRCSAFKEGKKKNSVWFEEEMSFEFEVFKLNI